MKTLIIVDPQIDFMPGGALPVPDGDRIIPVINRILPNFDLVIATQDWHPERHQSFAVNHPGKNEFDVIELDGLEQTLWPVHCVQGTPGAEFHSDLETRPIEAIFRKGMEEGIDSYSGFYDNGHRKSTGLTGYLKEKGTTDLYFCGLAADICVYFTLKDALQEGFSSHLIEDAAIPLNQTDYMEIKEELRSRGAKIISSNSL